MDKLESKLRKYDEAYYSGKKPLISDQEYDNLVNQYELVYGPYVKVSNETQLLPMAAPSLDKIKLPEKLQKWDIERPGEKILSDKIDGMSIIIEYNDSVTIYTHSDSTHGTNISHLLPYLNIPKKLDRKLKVRGEMTIKLSTFEKYKGKYDSPRNMIPGVLKKKVPEPEILKDLDYLVFQIESGNMCGLNVEEQYQLAKNLGFDIVTGIYKRDQLSYEEIKQDLQSPCPYPRDGKTIALNVYEEPSPQLPENKIAFKIIGETAITKVISIEWNESRHCLLKPRINFENVYLDKADLSWTSGFHAKFIKTNHIGSGTKLLITRSGGIIPYILEIVESTEESLPTCSYQWDKTETNILCDVNDEVIIKRLHYFFELLESKNLGLKMIEKLYHAGYNTINTILSVTIDDLTKIKGVQMKGAERVLVAIKTGLKNVTLSKVIVGSCLFPGFGEIKIEAILNAIPKLYNILLFDSDELVTVEELKNVGGINKMALVFMDQLPDFQEFLNEIPNVKKILIDKFNIHKQLSMNADLLTTFDINNTNDINNANDIITPPLIIPEAKGYPMKNMYIVFSGDKKLTNKCKELGAIVDANVKKQTTLLVVDQVGTMNNKEKICTEKKIPIMSLKDFKLKYNL